MYDPFEGQNNIHEIETYEEFIEKSKDIGSLTPRLPQLLSQVVL